MKINSIKTNCLSTICWFKNTIVDFCSAGKQYFFDGNENELFNYHYFCDFDGAITSETGEYAFIYQRLGTKGLLLKNGKLIKEIDRSYYKSNIFEFPAVFITLKNKKTYLIHCLFFYNRIDFEDVETGEIVTNISGRNPTDYFHSRFEISPDNKYLLSKGWYWHPWSSIQIFDLEACFLNPLLLDKSSMTPSVPTEICTASFISNSTILIGTSSEESRDEDETFKLPSSSIAIWNFETDEIINPITLNFPFGNLFAINDLYAWDTYGNPKIINIKKGEIVNKNDSILSGHQDSAFLNSNTPMIAFDRKTKNIAIAIEDKLTIIHHNID